MNFRKLNKSYHIYGRILKMKRLKTLILIVLCTGFQLAYAEGAIASDYLSNMGKIYVVAGVCLVILIALFVFLFQLDRKISRIEKRYNND